MTAVAFDFLKERFWHLVCHRSHVSRPGDYVRLEWYDDEIVVFNDEGNVFAFDNVCPHRGFRIFAGTHGNQRLRCPYHGWSYKRGTFFAPFPTELDQAQVDAARFNMLQVRWCGDFLFVGISPQQSLDEQLGGLSPLLVKVGESIAAPYSVETFVWQSDWRIAIENALEQYHTAVGIIHRDSFNRFKTSAGVDEFYGNNTVYRCEYLDERTAKRLERLTRMFAIDFQHRGYLSVFVFPFAMIGSTYGYSYAMQHFFPSRVADETYFSTRMLRSKLRGDVDPGLLDSFFASARDLNRQIFDEDHEACKRVSPRSLAPDFTQILATSEAKIAHFRSCLASASPA